MTDGAPFGARLTGRVAERGSQVVLGLDPDPARLWPAASGRGGGAGGDPAARAAAAVSAHGRAVIDAVGASCVAVKLQLACFERLGAPGWAALAEVQAHARDAGLLTIADGKRGDVPVTAAAYAQALVGSTPVAGADVPGLGADALTANPLLGRDALAPLVEGARAAGAGAFILVRTSNPGAADLQDALISAEGGLPAPLWERLAGWVHELGFAPAAGELADVGAVTGATAPEHLQRMRELMPAAVFLVPGVGAQGGRVEDLAAAFGPGPASVLVTASRSIVDAGAGGPGDRAVAAREAAERLREAAWALSA